VLPRFPRRKLLLGGLGLGLGVAGTMAALVRTSGYIVPAGVTLASLTPWEWLVVRALARRVCAADREGVVTPDETDVVGFVDAYTGKMPRRMRRDLGRFLGVIEHVAPLSAGTTTRFSDLGPAEQDRVLSSLEASDNDLFRGGWAGLKSLLFMGYYRDPRTWAVLGYDGPLVRRPEGGWR
jgi:hypothetical protein